MGIFRINLDADESARIEKLIESSFSLRRQKHGDYAVQEENLAKNLLSYSSMDVPDISYDFFRAREYVKLFPEDDSPQGNKVSGIRRFMRRLIRRLVRPQIVFNEFILGAIEDIDRRLSEIEKKRGKRSDNGSSQNDGIEK